MSLLRVCSALVLLDAACGFDVVDFEPRASPANVEVVVVGSVPQAAIDRLRAAGTAKHDAKRLTFSYPAQGVVLPANVAPLTWRWSTPGPAKMGEPASPAGGAGPANPAGAAGPAAPAGAAVYELSLRRQTRELRIYTSELSGTAPAESWSLLLNGATSEPLTVQLRALSGGPKAELLETDPQTLPITDALATGSMYFETASGIARVRIGDGPAALSYPLAAGSDCRAGHAISRDGTRLGIACADAAGAIWSLPALSLLRSLAMEPGVESFGAFDPTSTHYVRARAGQLEIVDLVGGAVQTLAPLAAAAGARMAEPDWSPDGQAIVFTYWPAPAGMAGKPSNAAAGSSIARVVRKADSWSEPQILVDAPSPTSALHAPQYAPDGSYLVVEDSGGDKMMPGALFWLAAQGGPLTPLLGMTSMGPDANKGALLPTWVPSARAGQAWLVYTSTREDGSAPASAAQRLWLSAVELTNAPMASAIAPAFVLPAQAAASEPRRLLFAREP